MPITLTVTAKGQITLRQDVLEHLGVRPGDKVDADLLKDGRLQIRAKRGKSVTAVFGMLATPGQPPRSIEDLNEAAAAGWRERCEDHGRNQRPAPRGRGGGRGERRSNRDVNRARCDRDRSAGGRGRLG